MKRAVKNIVLLIVLFILSSCGKKSYVVFDYNCNGQEYHKCELKNNKLNCKVETPICGEYNFTGWYKANEYKNQVDLNGTFNKNEIIYARWEENGQVIESSSQELVSTIITPGEIDEPSSSKIEYSSQIIEEPSSQQPVPEATYTILFNANGGSGGQSQQISGVKYGNDLPAINQTKPTKTGYTFLGWYDSQTGGTQYYNSSNSPVRKYDKKSNITLYAQWRINVLSIQYNGNGGTWISTNSRFGVNSSGTVIEKSTGKIYSKEINYGTNTESSGLTDYNGSWFKWKRDGYYAQSGKEYYLQNGSIKNTLDQTKVYSAADLAKYSGCDLSKNDCTITVKVNWKKNTYVDYGPCKIEYKKLYVGHDKYEYGLCVPEKYNGEKLPLIFFLHGMNSNPEDPFYTNFYTWSNRDFNGVINKWPKYGLKNIPAIIVMPWSRGRDKWNNKWKFIHVDAVYNEVVNNYNIDTDNVCLIGHSIGGQGVFTVAAEFPTRFKSLVPMSALITKPPAGDIEYFAKMPMKGFAEKYNPAIHSEYYNYEKKMTELFNNIRHPNDLRVVPVKHGSVPEYALTIDDNKDGISDLVYWIINGGKDPEL